MAKRTKPTDLERTEELFAFIKGEIADKQLHFALIRYDESKVAIVATEGELRLLIEGLKHLLGRRVIDFQAALEELLEAAFEKPPGG